MHAYELGGDTLGGERLGGDMARHHSQKQFCKDLEEGQFGTCPYAILLATPNQGVLLN